MAVARRIASAYREAFSGLPRAVWLLALANLVNRSGTMVLPFLSLYLTQSLGFTASQAGKMLSLYGLGTMVGSYLGGWLCDRIGPQRVQLLSFLATGAGFIAAVQLRSFAALAVAVTMISVVAEAFRPALFVAVAQHSSPQVRTRAFVLIRLATNLGMALGPTLGGLLAARNYAWIFWGDALTCWAAAVLLAGTFGISAARSPEETASAEPAGRTPWRDPPFLGFLGLTVVLSMVFLQLWTTFPLYLKERFLFSERAIGAVFALNPILIALFEMVLVKSLEHRDLLRMIGLGSLVVCLSLGALALGSGALIPIGVMVMLTLGEMLTFPMCNAIVAQRAGTESTGRYMGAYTLSFGIAFFLSPALGTAVYESLGPRALWFGIASTGVLLGAGFAALAPRFRR
ncbi:MAG: MFS transporter [bacterium]|nr:MFS transporter [bacterium]